jgi:hypothetical protein
MVPRVFSRGQAILIGLTFTGIRHGNTSVVLLCVASNERRVTARRGINSPASGVAGRTACERREGRQSEKRRATE